MVVRLCSDTVGSGDICWCVLRGAICLAVPRPEFAQDPLLSRTDLEQGKDLQFPGGVVARLPWAAHPWPMWGVHAEGA